MRGVVSAGMTAAIEQLGLRDCFDEVHGASAGRVQRRLPARRPGRLSDRAVPARVRQPDLRQLPASLLRGRPVFDMDYVIGEVWRHQRPLRTDADPGQRDRAALHGDRCRHRRRSSTSPTCPTTRRSAAAMRASGRLPWLAGPAGRVPRPSAAGCDAGRGDPGRTRPDAPRPTCSSCRRARTASQHSPLSGPVARLTDRLPGQDQPGAGGAAADTAPSAMTSSAPSSRPQAADPPPARRSA